MNVQEEAYESSEKSAEFSQTTVLESRMLRLCLRMNLLIESEPRVKAAITSAEPLCGGGTTEEHRCDLSLG